MYLSGIRRSWGCSGPTCQDPTGCQGPEDRQGFQPGGDHARVECRRHSRQQLLVFPDHRRVQSLHRLRVPPRGELAAGPQQILVGPQRHRGQGDILPLRRQLPVVLIPVHPGDQPVRCPESRRVVLHERRLVLRPRDLLLLPGGNHQLAHSHAQRDHAALQQRVAGPRLLAAQSSRGGDLEEDRYGQAVPLRQWQEHADIL
mmetsp:Transcript_65059/g.172913  ORF Transcript_65059/g.172913 Transcript_65059/m.172913 type:complete len:201 (+) Transcript_65059:205-807(+)